MSSRHSLRGGAGLALLAGLVLASFGRAQNCDCQACCCPPYFKYYYEGAPKIKFKHGCPKPICDPCHLPHYGYYATCWQPWPFPPDWSHCPVPPPGALVQPIPPKRFRGEPTTDDKEKNKDRERDPSEVPVPPRRLDDAATPQYLPPSSPVRTPAPEPMATVPAASGAVTPQPLPSGPATEANSHEPVSVEAPVPPVTPAPLRSLISDPVTPVEKREVPPVIAPMSLKTVEPPNPLPTALAARAAERKVEEPQHPRTIGPSNSGPAKRMVNSHRVQLDYDLKSMPGSEHSVLELWYTMDTRRWYKDETTVKSGAPYVIEVNREGTYGFMMVARNATENSVAPAAGEAPQIWVEVDWTKPVVSLSDVKVGSGYMGRTASIHWTATDSNLTQKPITLSYAESPEGPWRTFAASLDNSGRYLWQVPSNVPANVFLRVEAFDLVGNVGVAQGPVQLP